MSIVSQGPFSKPRLLRAAAEAMASGAKPQQIASSYGLSPATLNELLRRLRAVSDWVVSRGHLPREIAILERLEDAETRLAVLRAEELVRQRPEHYRQEEATVHWAAQKILGRPVPLETLRGEREMRGEWTLIPDLPIPQPSGPAKPLTLRKSPGGKPPGRPKLVQDAPLQEAIRELLGAEIMKPRIPGGYRAVHKALGEKGIRADPVRVRLAILDLRRMSRKPGRKRKK